MVHALQTGCLLAYLRHNIVQQPFVLDIQRHTTYRKHSQPSEPEAANNDYALICTCIYWCTSVDCCACMFAVLTCS